MPKLRAAVRDYLAHTELRSDSISRTKIAIFREIGKQLSGQL